MRPRVWVGTPTDVVTSAREVCAATYVPMDPAEPMLKRIKEVFAVSLLMAWPCV